MKGWLGHIATFLCGVVIGACCATYGIMKSNDRMQQRLVDLREEADLELERSKHLERKLHDLLQGMVK